MNTFNKVWIVPEKAVVYENAEAGTAYVVESKLKAMPEEDYLSYKSILRELSSKQELMMLINLASNCREIVIPEFTKEINEDKNFVQLRQVYNSLILAAWYKKKIKDSILAQVYADKNKVAGVNIDDPKEKEKIYQRYLKAFKRGVYNYIKEETVPFTQQILPRKYFSGGTQLIDDAQTIHDGNIFNKMSAKNLLVVSGTFNLAMRTGNQVVNGQMGPVEIARIKRERILSRERDYFRNSGLSPLAEFESLGETFTFEDMMDSNMHIWSIDESKRIKYETYGDFSSSRHLSLERREEINEYVEGPAQRLVMDILEFKGVPLWSNAYGPAYKCVIWQYKGKKYVTLLSSDDYEAWDGAMKVMTMEAPEEFALMLMKAIKDKKIPNTVNWNMIKKHSKLLQSYWKNKPGIIDESLYRQTYRMLMQMHLLKPATQKSLLNEFWSMPQKLLNLGEESLIKYLQSEHQKIIKRSIRANQQEDVSLEEELAFVMFKGIKEGVLSQPLRFKEVNDEQESLEKYWKDLPGQFNEVIYQRAFELLRVGRIITWKGELIEEMNDTKAKAGIKQARRVLIQAGINFMRRNVSDYVRQIIGLRLSGKRIDGFWSIRRYAKESVWLALGKDPRFEKARLKGDLVKMVKFFREDFLGENPKFKRGLVLYFRQVGALNSLMSKKRPFLDKRDSPAALLRFAVSGMIDEDAPGMIRPWEMEIVWNDPRLAKKAIIQALGQIPEFKAARLAGDLKNMAKAYRDYLLTDWPGSYKGGQVGFFRNVGNLYGLMKNEKLFLDKKDCPAALLRFAVPGLISEDAEDMLRPWEVEERWGDPRLAQKAIIQTLDKIPKFQKARLSKRSNKLELMAEAYSSYLLGNNPVYKGGQVTYFYKIGKLEGLMSGSKSFLTKRGSPQAVLEFAMPDFYNYMVNHKYKLGRDYAMGGRNRAMIGISKVSILSESSEIQMEIHNKTNLGAIAYLFQNYSQKFFKNPKTQQAIAEYFGLKDMSGWDIHVDFQGGILTGKNRAVIKAKISLLRGDEIKQEYFALKLSSPFLLFQMEPAVILRERELSKQFGQNKFFNEHYGKTLAVKSYEVDGRFIREIEGGFPSHLYHLNKFSKYSFQLDAWSEGVTARELIMAISRSSLGPGDKQRLAKDVTKRILVTCLQGWKDLRLGKAGLLFEVDANDVVIQSQSGDDFSKQQARDRWNS